MNVIRFKLPDNFQPKTKKYRRRKISRCVWISPETLFTLCEILLRKLVLPVVPRRKFWSTIISLLPNETARSTVRHQVECPWDFNRPQRAIVNYANHWTLLSATAQHQHPVASNIRVGSLVRNKITQLLLDLDYCSSSGSDGLPQGVQQQFESGYFPDHRYQYEMRLTSEFVARSAAANMEASASAIAAKLNPEGVLLPPPRCYSCCNCGGGGGRYNLNPLPSLMIRKPAVHQLMVMGQGTLQQQQQQQATRSSCQVQINDVIPCGCCQAKM